MAKHLTINRRYQLPPELEIISDVENPALNRIDICVIYPEQERVCPNCGFENFRKRLLLICGPIQLVHSPVDDIHDKLSGTDDKAS